MPDFLRTVVKILMKILQITNSITGSGGAGKLMVPLSRYLEEQGHDVTILQLIEGKGVSVFKEIEQYGGEVRWLKMKGSVYNPFIVFRLIKWLKMYDIVNVHLFPSFYWAAFAKILSFCKTPLVYTEHSTTNKRRNSVLFRTFDGFLYRNCYKKIIACADKVLESFLQTYPRSTNCIAINNGVDTNRYNASQDYSKGQLCGVSEDSIIITMVARFVYPKRQDTIVKALAKLPSNFHAVFVGAMPEDGTFSSVKHIVDNLNVNSRVHFLGVRSDVPEILKSSDIVVMSSEYEGLSLSSLEAMSSGKPLIAADVNGLREVVRGVGILFDVNNEQQLADEIIKLVDDQSYYNSIAANCFARALQYDYRVMGEKYLKAYISVLGD